MAKKCNDKKEMDVIKVELLITTEEGKELAELLSRIGEPRISKCEAMKYINCSPATFNRQVEAGKIPKGKHRIGFKEQFWYKSEILETIDKNK